MLLDGGVGTELIARGLDTKIEPADAWNWSHPADVQAVYRAYFEAGADAVQTNSFGANRLRLGLFQRANEVRALNVGAAIMAREVRPSGKLVIGDIGPTGAIPPPEGVADLAELEDVFAEQAMALAAGRAARRAAGRARAPRRRLDDVQAHVGRVRDAARLRARGHARRLPRGERR